MKLFSSLSVALLLVCLSSFASFTIVEKGRPLCVIVSEPEATNPESNAFNELFTMLDAITGVTPLVEPEVDELIRSNRLNERGLNMIIVGPGALAKTYFPEENLDKFGPEEFVIKTKGNKLLLAGGRPRGTIYAVNRFLQQECGVRWWTPWATNIPTKTTLKFSSLNIHEKPAFEYRGPYWYPGFEPHWKVHNFANDEMWNIPDSLGGCIKYKGYCHTFYPLVSPEKHFKDHPEWFSLVKGKRTSDHAQLCLTNPKLREFMVTRVKEWLRDSPDAQIISVTQNDNAGWCECPNCKALDDAEGSHAGTMVDFVNSVAEQIEAEFPHVWVDTFAYQYTRHPPKHIRPRKNVIIRLCSIECNFRKPFTDKSNADFLADLQEWSKICQHLYVWDYSTDFSHYICPHPNWFELGENARIFQQYGVKGFFSEGAYAGQGHEMAELRGWVLAQLMWNPKQDARKLIREFLDGYYGLSAAKYIYDYMQLMHDESKDYFLACYRHKYPPYLEFAPLAKAELLWQNAERAVTNDPEKLARVRIAHLPVLFAWLDSWQKLRHECWEKNGHWPISSSRKAVADQFKEICDGVPGKDWTVVHVLSERGTQVSQFLADFQKDPPDLGPEPPRRIWNAPPPKDLPRPPRRAVDLQDNLAFTYKPGEFSEIRYDAAASDLRAVWMPGTHTEWAFRVFGTHMPKRAQHGKWDVYAVVRVEKNDGCPADAPAFSAGVYGNSKKEFVATITPQAKETSDSYRSYLIGTVKGDPDRDVWISPSGNKNIKAIYVDRIYLVPAKSKN